MTVCIAALCQDEKNRPAIMCATDSEISNAFTSSQFHLKTDPLPGRWTAMLSAGNIGHAEALLTEVGMRLTRFDAGDFNIVLRELDEARQSVLARLVAYSALPPGLTLDRYYSEGQQILPDWAYQSIWRALTQFRLDCDLLIAGLDSSGRAHLVTVGEEPAMQHDRGEYYAVGSGAVNAIGILAAHDPNFMDDWRTSAYQVYAAKKASERARGVGEVTYLFIVTYDGMQLLDNASLDRLLADYGLLLTMRRTQKLRQRIREVPLLGNTALVEWGLPSGDSAPDPTS